LNASGHAGDVRHRSAGRLVPRVHSGAAHAADTETIPPTKSLYFVTNVSKTEDRAQLFWGTVNPGVDMNGSRPPKAAMLVARRIVADIARDSLKPGDVLPPERTMPGPRGGPVLLDPDASHLANAVVLLMQLKEAPFRTIMEVRSALEPVISSLAAMRISDKALAELYSTIEEMGDNLGDEHTFLDANKRFHEIIAWSSDNPLFGYHNPSTAEALMRRHIDEYVNYAERTIPEVLGQVIPWDRMFT
jgi:GntR family transcriptional repressor for pyruvate dehydrogenase complex